MIRKFAVLFVSLLIILAVPISAVWSFSIKPSGEFYVYGRDNEKLCEVVGVDDIDGYCKERSIKYLAINEDNTRQIALLAKESDFSGEVVNLSLLSDEKIKELMPDIIGLENVKGEILDKNGQKFIKTSIKSSDSGGEYTSTQYYTVAGEKIYVLSFYSAAGEDTEYVQKTFESFTADDFVAAESDTSEIKTLVILAFAAFAICIVIVLITIVRDIVKKPE